MSNTLEITGLHKAFGNFELKNISFPLPEGYIMGFIGPNGAGKTTVIRLILNLLKKDKGDIKVFGLDHTMHEEEIRESIGIVLEQPNYFESWTPSDLAKAIGPFYKTWDNKKYRQYLKDFGLIPEKRIKNLSKGMKMKLMIAVALSHDTRFLILDEPTSGLDAITRNELMEILGGYVVSEEKSILFSTHITADLEKIADYITLLNNGRLIFTGTKDEILESFCLIKGATTDLSPEQKSEIIGYTEHQTGFEGLLLINGIKCLSKNILTDPASLDDIILFTNKGGGRNE